MDEGLTKREEVIACRILKYLMRHPHATDTAEGLTRWWLLEEEIHERVSEVSQGLSFLVEQGFLLENKRPEAAPLYRLNPNRQHEIRKALENFFGLPL